MSVVSASLNPCIDHMFKVISICIDKDRLLHSSSLVASGLTVGSGSQLGMRLGLHLAGITLLWLSVQYKYMLGNAWVAMDGGLTWTWELPPLFRSYWQSFSTVLTMGSHGSPARARYGVRHTCLLWIQSLNYVLPFELHAISRCIGPWYIENRL